MSETEKWTDCGGGLCTFLGEICSACAAEDEQAATNQKDRQDS